MAIKDAMPELKRTLKFYPIENPNPQKLTEEQIQHFNEKGYIFPLDVFSEIAFDPEARSADRIKAIHELGAFGLGAADQAAIHIHAGEGSQVIGVVHLPTLDVVPDDEPAEVAEPAVDGPLALPEVGSGE